MTGGGATLQMGARFMENTTSVTIGNYTEMGAPEPLRVRLCCPCRMQLQVGLIFVHGKFLFMESGNRTMHIFLLGRGWAPAAMAGG